MLLYERFLAARDVSDFHPIQMPELSEWEDIYGLHSTSVYPAAWLVNSWGSAIAGKQPCPSNPACVPQMFIKPNYISFVCQMALICSGRLNYTAEIPVSIKAEITE